MITTFNHEEENSKDDILEYFKITKERAIFIQATFIGNVVFNGMCPCPHCNRHPNTKKVLEICKRLHTKISLDANEQRYLYFIMGKLIEESNIWASAVLTYLKYIKENDLESLILEIQNNL